ncbi:MAG TPA: penicillin acylase family protein [Burkholderiales bacterium]|nr:penicillin acylase family protein [Burkholderiales bacterium]
MVRAVGLHLAACLFLSFETAWAQAPAQLAGLHESATISTDGEGIVHVRANNEHDLYFLQGWTHARERLFQMDSFRRLASGTYAELVGPAALANDVALRTLGLRRAAQRSYDAASPRTRNALQAYADGVNAWAATHPLPIEYGALELTAFAPWSALDSVAVGKLITWQQSFDDDTVATVAFLSYAAALGPASATKLFHDDLWRSAGFEPDATVPDAMAGASALLKGGIALPAVQQADEGSARLIRGHLERTRQLSAFRGALSREARGGSNLWAISGARARDGRPLVANDPHVTLSIPALFYPMGLELDEEPVFGHSVAGAPGIIHGYNRHIAWGTTNSFTDVTDWFSEQVVPDASSPSGLSTLYLGAREPLIPIPQVFRANVLGNGIANDLVVVAPSSTIPPATLVMARRDGGPIVRLDNATGAALSVQWVGFGPTQELEAFLMINRARNLDEFKDALQRFDAGAQNFVYADVEGNIAFFSAGEVPVREDLESRSVNGSPPWFVRNGQGGNEWLGVRNPQPQQATPREIIPFAEMPQIVNPPAGWFVNANNDPLGITRDNSPLNQLRPGGGLFYLAYSFNRGLRAQRINTRLRELLESGDQRVSFEEMQAVQGDNVLRDAEVFKPYLVAAFDRAPASGVPALAGLAADPAVAAAIARLRAWNGSTPTQSVEASIHAIWRARLIANVIDARLGALPKPDEQDTVAALRHLLDHFAANGGVGASGIDFFAAPGIAAAADRRDFWLLTSLREALDRLPALFGGSTNLDDYRWGALQRIALNHALGAPFSIPPIPTDGGFQTVDPASFNVRAATAQDFVYSFGSVHRSVYELAGDASRGASIWAGGTSGNPLSPNYGRFVGRWVGNQTVPLLLGKEEVKKSGAELQHYVPAP